MTPATIDRNLGVDARAGALLIAELARRHVARGAAWGRIVGLTSGGPAGFPSEVSYGAAKAALENYTLSAATELAPFGITANVVHPPVTDTGWVTDEVRAFVAASPDHHHIASPAEVAESHHLAVLGRGAIGHRVHAAVAVTGRLMEMPDPTDAHARRVERLRHEMHDEGIWLPADPALGELLLTELDYARHPHAHEGVAPRYGALLAAAVPTTAGVGPLELVDVTDVPLDVVRRLADGRSSFLGRTVGGPDRLICFERTREYESSAVHLAASTGALVLQRLGRGWVRLTTSDGVATWDGIHWSTKPLAAHIAARLRPELAGADPDRARQPRGVRHPLARRRARRRDARVAPRRRSAAARPPRVRRHRRHPPAGADAAGPLRPAAQRPVPVRPGRARRCRAAGCRPSASTSGPRSARAGTSPRTAAPGTPRRCASPPTNRPPS